MGRAARRGGGDEFGSGPGNQRGQVTAEPANRAVHRVGLEQQQLAGLGHFQARLRRLVGADDLDDFLRPQATPFADAQGRATRSFFAGGQGRATRSAALEPLAQQADDLAGRRPRR